MDLEALPIERSSLHQLIDKVGLAGRRGECRDEVLVCADVVNDRTWRYHPRPTHQAGNTECAFKVRRFLAPKRRRAAVRPSKSFGAIVARVNDDRVIGYAKIIDQLQQLSDVAVGLHHAVGIYGVNNKVGVFFSDFQKGNTFNAPYKRIRKEWFFHNPTRSNVGSLGIVADVPDDAITSPEYQVWRIKSGLLPGFVATLIATQFFIDLIQIYRVGAVKQRLYVENLLQIPVPVVPDAVQRKIADRREFAMQEIADAQARVLAANADVEAMIVGTKPV